MLQFTPWALPPLLALLILGSIYQQSAANRSVPGTTALQALLIITLVWAGTELLTTILTSADAQRLLTQIALCCSAIAPLAWVSFALAYGTQQLTPARPVINALGCVPLLIVIAAVTNGWHGLLWKHFVPVEVSGTQLLVPIHGPLFMVHIGYSAMLIVIGTTVLTYVLGQSRSPVKPVVAALAAAGALALTTAFEIAEWNPYPWLDLSTCGYALAGLFLREGMLRQGLLNRRRVVRHQVVDALADGVLVLNAEGLVVDANASGLKIVNMDQTQLSQTNISELITTIPFASMNERQRSSVELTLDHRAYEVNTSPLNPDEPLLDSVLVFRDVTRRREQEQQLKKMQQELEQLAHTDPLTMLSNRRIFVQRLEEEIQRVRRHGSSLSIILLDLDHFKSVNDSYGHDVGDQVLRTVARVTAHHTRMTDVAARVGGEEFALLLPETQKDGAVQLAQRLRIAIEAARTPIAGAVALQVTASIGVATVERDSKRLEDIMKQADIALYEAKEAGRNQVCIARSI